MLETATQSVKSPATQGDTARRALIDRSMRLPVIFFFTSGMLWLLISMVLGLLASIKTHSPDAFVPAAWLTYGRLQPAHLNAFIYGWGIQVGLGTALWIMARLCRTPLKSPVLLLLAGHFWNLAVLIGVACILGGKGTSMEFLDFPAFTWPVLFLAYAVIAGHLIVMFKSRPEGHIYISQWYFLAAAFWFPWIYATANLFIHHFPSAGVASAAINAWYVGTLLVLWFVSIGLGTTYYLIPKIVGKPIHSYQLALASFWGLAILGGWVGMQQYAGGPLPAWMPAVSGAAMIFLAIPMVAIGANHHNTVKGQHYLIHHSPTLRFSFFGAISFNVFIVMGAFLALFKVFQFTYAELGWQMIGLYAFFTMIMFGAIYFIMPRLMDCEWHSGKWIRHHFWFSGYGTISMVIALLLGGLFQGVQASNYDQAFVLSAEVSQGFMVGNSLAWAFMILSNLIFFFHLLLMVFRLGRRSGEATLIHPLEEQEASGHARAVGV